MRSSRLAFAAALAAALFALLPATGSEASKKACKVRGSATVVQTRLVRVFTTGADRLKYFVCYRQTGKKTQIGVQTGPEQTYLWKLAGRFVPYVNATLGDRDVVRLRDVKSGELKFDLTILLKDGGGHGSSLATPSGGLAFILHESTPEDHDVLSLYGHKAGTDKHAYTKLSTEEVKDIKGNRDVVSWTTLNGNPGSADLGP